MNAPHEIALIRFDDAAIAAARAAAAASQRPVVASLE